VDPNQAYSAAEVERMMKLQDVLLKAMAGKMHWWEAAEIIGVSCRTMRRWRERLEKHGYDGLTDRRKGKRSQRRVAVKTCEEVLRLYQERYFDLSVRHFHEKLKAEHAIELSYTWVKQALQGAGEQTNGDDSLRQRVRNKSSCGNGGKISPSWHIIFCTARIGSWGRRPSRFPWSWRRASATMSVASSRASCPQRHRQTPVRC